MRERRDFRSLGGCSYDAIADELGMTKQAVQQIERKALWKLRRLLEEVGFDPADYEPEQRPESYWERM